MPGLGLNGSLFMGTHSLIAQRTAIEVTGHNLSNVNTPNYARQRAELVSDLTLNLGLGEQGMGASVRSIESLRSRLLDDLIVDQKHFEGFHRMRSELTSLVQDSFGEDFVSGSVGSVDGFATDTGLQGAFGRFFDAFQQLSAAPTDSTIRQQVVQRGEDLVLGIQSIYQRLSDVQAGIASDADALTIDINQAAGQIARLNEEIVRIESGTGRRANDLRNQRTEELENLSKLVNVTSVEQANGMLTISLTDVPTVTLVDGVDSAGSGTTESLSATYNTTVNPPLVISGSVSGALATSIPSSGELGAQLRVANEVIGSGVTVGNVGFLGRLDQLAVDLRTQVNAAHATGFDLNGAAGGDFFLATNTGALDLAVDAAIVADADLIAAGDGSGPLSGANSIALARLRNDPLLAEAHRDMVADIGFVVQEAKNADVTQGLVSSQLTRQRESISGVSIDEEMTNLVRFQQAYDASARFITVISEMFERLVNGTG